MYDTLLFDIGRNWIIEASAYRKDDWTYRTDWQLWYNDFETCEELMKYVLEFFDDDKQFFFNY